MSNERVNMTRFFYFKKGTFDNFYYLCAMIHLKNI